MSDPPDQTAQVVHRGVHWYRDADGVISFYNTVRVGHVEAGLRTFDKYSPFPEEINRRLTSQLASLHLAPTRTSRANLVAENVKPSRIFVTGNTVIDALHSVVARRLAYSDLALERLDGRSVLITAHRRESWGAPMAASARAIATLARRYLEVTFVLPAHLNPVVREVLNPFAATVMV